MKATYRTMGGAGSGQRVHISKTAVSLKVDAWVMIHRNCSTAPLHSAGLAGSSRDWRASFHLRCLYNLGGKPCEFCKF